MISFVFPQETGGGGGNRNEYFLEHNRAAKNPRNKDGRFASCLYLCLCLECVFLADVC